MEDWRQRCSLQREGVPKTALLWAACGATRDTRQRCVRVGCWKCRARAAQLREETRAVPQSVTAAAVVRRRRD